MTQKKRVLNYMIQNRGITTADGLKMYPMILDVRARIRDLRNEGYPIRRIWRKSKNARYGKWILLSGITEQCPHCGTIYDTAEIEEYGTETQMTYMDVWHYCPLCGEIIDDDPQPMPDDFFTIDDDEEDDDDMFEPYDNRVDDLIAENKRMKMAHDYYRR